MKTGSSTFQVVVVVAVIAALTAAAYIVASRDPEIGMAAAEIPRPTLAVTYEVSMPIVKTHRLTPTPRPTVGTTGASRGKDFN